MEIGVAVGVSAKGWKRTYTRSMLELAQMDLALRMRNQLALELLDRTDEHIINDEPVLLADNAEVSKKGRAEGLPTPGWMMLTNHRLLYARLTDKQRTDLYLSDARVTHVEDGWVTFAWREDGWAKRALTIGFMPKTEILGEILNRVPGDKVYTGAGGATPGKASTRERIAKAVKRSSKPEPKPDA